MSEDGRPTSPWSGEATMNSLQAPDAACLPLRGRVRMTKRLYYGVCPFPLDGVAEI